MSKEISYAFPLEKPGLWDRVKRYLEASCGSASWKLRGVTCAQEPASETDV